jgi:hypothetical protein
MYESKVSSEYDGRSLIDFVCHMGFEMGFEWKSNAYLVSLDSKFVAPNYMQEILVREGQMVKIFPMPAGG